MPYRNACRPILTPVLALLMMLPAGISAAGPWPRVEKGTFVSATAERDGDGNSYAGLYGEYGLTARETLGFELGHTNVGETSVMFWLQHGLEPKGENRLALSLGLGVIQRDGLIVPQAQAGADWGRGFQGILQGGWLSVESRIKVAGSMIDPQDFQDLSPAAFSYLTPEVTTKADVTLGLHVSDSMMFINQLRLEERQDTGFSSKLASSVVQDLTGPAKLELGVVLPLSGPDEQAVKLGTWLEF